MTTINTTQFAKLLGITNNALLKRIRRGVLLKNNLMSPKDEHGFYYWYLEDVEYYMKETGLYKEKFDLTVVTNEHEFHMQMARSIIGRIKYEKWPYDTDNEVFAGLHQDAKQLIMDALNEQT
jgi:hypothetical protein